MLFEKSTPLINELYLIYMYNNYAVEGVPRNKIKIYFRDADFSELEAFFSNLVLPEKSKKVFTNCLNDLETCIKEVHKECYFQLKTTNTNKYSEKYLLKIKHLITAIKQCRIVFGVHSVGIPKNEQDVINKFSTYLNMSVIKGKDTEEDGSMISSEKDLFKYALGIPDLTLRRIVFNIKRSIEVEEVIDKSIKAIKYRKKLFGSDDIPTPEQVSELKKSNPTTHAKFLLVEKEKRESLKDLVKSIFVNNEWHLVKTNVLIAELKDLGVTEHNIERNFPGLIDLHLHYYTHKGEQLTPDVGRDFVPNPDYESDSGSSDYGKSINSANNEVPHYTISYKTDNASQKFGKVIEFGEVIEDIRSKIAEDIKSSDHTTATMAFMIHLLDDVYLRVGTTGKENGLHNLKVSSFIKRDNKYFLEYFGKKNVFQSHRIKNSEDIQILKELIKGKKKTDYIFTSKGKLITDKKLNKYLKSLGVPEGITCHKFRHFHGTRIAYELLIENNPFKVFRKDGKLIIKRGRTIVTKKEVADYFNEATVKVGEVLGHKHGDTTTGSTAIKNYIDPSVMIQFWESVQLPLPAKVVAVAKSGSKDKEEEVEAFVAMLAGIIVKAISDVEAAINNVEASMNDDYYYGDLPSNQNNLPELETDDVSQLDIPHKTVEEEKFSNWMGENFTKIMKTNKKLAKADL